MAHILDIICLKIVYYDNVYIEILVHIIQYLYHNIIPKAFVIHRKYPTPEAKTFMSCSPKMFTATPFPRRSICAIFPKTRPSGDVIPSMAA